jgi:TrmH family RNA methyltransferase
MKLPHKNGLCRAQNEGRVSLNNPYKSFHSSCEEFRKQIHIVLVRPEYGGNIGSTARAIENMGVLGSFCIVANKDQVEWSEVRKMAKHAFSRVGEAQFFETLSDALVIGPDRKKLVLGASARVGSASRPHPLKVRPALEKAVRKVKLGEVTDLFLVFGPESDGLSNEDIELCDWLVTIPSHPRYRSLNLAQSVLVFAHEINENLQEPWSEFQSDKPNQKEKLVQHLLKLAEDSGFILPGDPLKMRPRLEEIFGQIPHHIPQASTLHGLIDQVSRSMKKGEPDIKGRYKYFLEGSSGGKDGIEPK